MIKLTLTEKGGEPKLLTFEKDEITIGRVSGNDIVLAKGNVSKRHSRFTAKPGGQIEVADLKSTNGTYVNGRKIISPTPLSANDRVYVGDFLITIDLGAGEEAEEEAGSASEHPAPPPPPPPRGTGSRAAQLPADDEGDTGYGDEDDEELGLAARPPRSGRMPIPPPPPPPPPRRPPTPLASRPVDNLDDDLDDLPPPPPDEDTGSVGLFAHSRPADEDISRRISVGARPGAPAAAPAFAAAPPAPAGRRHGYRQRPGAGGLLADASVRQVLITAPDAALVDRGAGLTLHDGGLGDPNAVADALWRLANTAFPPPAPDNPVVDVRLPDGSHMTAAFPPAAPGGVVAAIRRPALVERALGDLLPSGARDAETLLTAVVAARRNVLVTGDVGAVSAALGALGAADPRRSAGRRDRGHVAAGAWWVDGSGPGAGRRGPTAGGRRVPARSPGHRRAGRYRGRRAGAAGGARTRRHPGRVARAVAGRGAGPTGNAGVRRAVGRRRRRRRWRPPRSTWSCTSCRSATAAHGSSRLRSRGGRPAR